MWVAWGWKPEVLVSLPFVSMTTQCTLCVSFLSLHPNFIMSLAALCMKRGQGLVKLIFCSGIYTDVGGCMVEYGGWLEGVWRDGIFIWEWLTQCSEAFMSYCTASRVSGHVETRLFSCFRTRPRGSIIWLGGNMGNSRNYKPYIYM